MDKNERAEFQLPPLKALWEPSFRIPFVCYFILFQIVGYCIRKYAWKSYFGFKQYRLRNLTVCVIHSSISGIWSFIFFITHQKVMFEDVIHWYSPFAAQLPILSMAYFICDTMDMFKHEISKFTFELLFHHVATLVVFAAAVLPRKFIPYAYWALLMEVNSVFLHLRSLMQITGYNALKQRLFGTIRFTNLVTFILFRFAVQIWQIKWAWINRHRFHIFYMGIAFIGGTFFLILNIILFIRVLASDGFLGKFGRRYAAVGRDSEKSIRVLEETKNK